MQEKIRCQSCGMPLSEEFGNFGTEKNGAENSVYCSFCFQNGEFTNPTQTLDEMIQSSVDNMTEDLNMSVQQATDLASSIIPTLGRWKQ